MTTQRPSASVRRYFGALCVLLVASPAWFSVQSLAAQDARRAQATRAELEANLKELDQYVTSTGYSGRLRDEKKREADLIRSRLADGDLQVGDRIEVTVAGEKAISDTFPVGAGRLLSLPGIPDIPLQGVLRSEAQDYLTKVLSRYIRNPDVHVRTMIRLSVYGSVGKPGFYQIPADMLATDAIMAAGGPIQDADPAKAFVRRGGVEIWPRGAFQDAIRGGLTLDQMNLRAGDELVIDPRKRPGGFNPWTIVGGIGALTSVFYLIRSL